jgi:hypothetical protein
MIVTARITSAASDGTGPFPAASAPVRTRAQRTGQVAVTGLIVIEERRASLLAPMSRRSPDAG